MNYVYALTASVRDSSWPVTPSMPGSISPLEGLSIPDQLLPLPLLLRLPAPIAYLCSHWNSGGGPRLFVNTETPISWSFYGPVVMLCFRRYKTITKVTHLIT